MTANQLSSHYPCLYHMAEPDAWPSICRHGLLSTEAVLDLLSPAHNLREQLLTQRRAQIVELRDPRYGTFRLRDQKPLNDTLLAAALTDMSVGDWYRLLNGKVFFWPTRERVLTLLTARAYRYREHAVITVDTAALLDRHVGRITLSRINSGATLYRPVPRGSNTFRVLADWPSDTLPRAGRLRRPVAEVAADHSLPDIANFATSVTVMRGQEVLRTLL